MTGLYQICTSRLHRASRLHLETIVLRGYVIEFLIRKNYTHIIFNANLFMIPNKKSYTKISLEKYICNYI